MVSLNFQITTSSNPLFKPPKPPHQHGTPRNCPQATLLPQQTTVPSPRIKVKAWHKRPATNLADLARHKSLLENVVQRLLELSSETLWPQFSDTYIIEYIYNTYHIYIYSSSFQSWILYKKEKTKFKSERKKNMQATFQLSNQTPPRLFPRQKSVIHIAPHSGTNGLTIS